MFFPLCAAALFFLSSSSLLDSAEGNDWPVARFTNGTVGLQNKGGKVMVNSNELHVIGDLIVKGQHLIPPKCMPPGGDKLQYNGTHLFCVCAENWSGRRSRRRRVRRRVRVRHRRRRRIPRRRRTYAAESAAKISSTAATES